MEPEARQPSERRRGRVSRWARGVLDLVLLGGLLYVGSLLVASAVEAAQRREQLRLLKSEARVLYRAFNEYHERNRAYPGAYVDPVFDVKTLDPLQRRGYYRGTILSDLYRHQADAYDSPDDQGQNREFWLEMSLASDPTIRVLVANSDDAPLGGGKWLDGVYVYRDGALERF